MESVLCHLTGTLRRRNDLPRHLLELLLPAGLAGDELPGGLHVGDDLWHDARDELHAHAVHVRGAGLGAGLHLPEVPRPALQRDATFLEQCAVVVGLYLKFKIAGTRPTSGMTYRLF